MKRKVGIAAIVTGIIGVAVVLMFAVPTTTRIGDQISSPSPCKGAASCIIGNVSRIVDGDTLDIGGTRIRLALINTPGIDEPGYNESRQFTSSVCPVGSGALADEDDGQPERSFGRMIAKVSCGDKILNEELLNAGLGQILIEFCSVSEFASESWAKQHC